MDTRQPLPFAVQLDGTDEPSDVIDAMSLGAFVAGEQPFAVSAKVQRLRADACLLPPGVDAARRAMTQWRRVHLAYGEGWTLLAAVYNDSTAQVTVTATTEAQAKGILDAATADASDPTPPADEATVVGFWHFDCSAQRAERTIAAARWPDIRRNYSSAVADAMERLAAATPDQVAAGRLLLLHGPPGTGKTTALRALAHAWRDWCRVDYVLDPEQMFQRPGYLMAALLGDEKDDDEKRWRMLVLEDCDELVRIEAKQTAGQGLSRLLNLTDGLVGQGLDVLVCLTTNEPLTRLHPAIIRPGRCLAHIHMGHLSPAEARRWLGNGDAARISGDGATLAELFALRGDLEQVDHTEEPHPNGQYL